MEEVKDGDTINVDGIEYRIGESSAKAINIWLKLSERAPNAEDMPIHLYRVASRGEDFVPASKIKESLQKKE
ncbi:MAG: hypothetical protein LiPW39_85 [Parcubacteria group bacterium LiPW_39]|nr:MAG: hypothetical protein LiPW39_85 [Parcubacteria group bacterium LiPW_39]